MDKGFLLQKLKNLSVDSAEDFKSIDEIDLWANQVAPLLEQIDYSCIIYFRAARMQSHYNNTTSRWEPNINLMLNQYKLALEKLKLQLEESNLTPDTKYFPQNSRLQIQVFVANLMTQAQNSIWIYDPYMDEKIIGELLNVNANEIRLITQFPTKIFETRLTAALTDFAGKKNIEVKISDSSHDRYYIIDEKVIWNLGASLKDAGKKATTANKITTEKEKQEIISDFNSWWNSASDFKFAR